MLRSTLRVAPVIAARPAAGARYEIEADLGAGGMGRVERGVDRVLGRRVALKRSLHGDPTMVALLQREAEIAARLDHPSIVTIHDLARDDQGEPFVVMRLVDGARLAELVAAQPDPAARLRLLPRLVAAVEAVAFAHRAGIVHRDLKPDNILIAELGDTVVIDWGLALDLREPRDPFAGMPIGTPAFMSPEQAAGHAVDARTDVFALGATLRFVLTGAPGGALRGAPRELAAIVAKATAPERDERYASAEELALELERFIGG